MAEKASSGSGRRMLREEESESTIYSIQQGEGSYGVGGGRDEILVVTSSRSPAGAYPAPSIPSPPIIGGATGELGARRIKFGVGGGPISSPAPPHGILRKGPRAAVGATKIESDPEDSSDKDDEEEEEEEGASDSDDLYSPLDKADLKEMSKGQVIRMWRASEMDLRRQLSQALKAKDDASSQLSTSRATTPAHPQVAHTRSHMIMEFDQVKI